MEYATFKTEIGRLALVYGEQPAERLLEYWASLRALADEPFRQACAAYKAKPDVRRFPFPNELHSLATVATTQAEARLRALSPGDYDEAKAFAEADAARREALRPPDPALVAHWEARVADMLARRDGPGAQAAAGRGGATAPGMTRGTG